MKYRIVIERPFGRIEIEAERLEEILNELRSFPEWMNVIDQSILERALAPEQREELMGIVESTVDGPAIIVPSEKVNSKEAIGLLLCASGPDGLEPKEVSRLLSLSGMSMAGYAARMSEMKREGLLLKEGDLYRLSVRGRNWVEEVISRLRG
ncbi:MAG: hypothetical protein ACE5L6_05845 [Candidatus Bathyarchaeia archaeon]